jgi:hypothetical protein
MLRTAVARRLGPIDEERTAGSISWVARLLEMDVAYDTVDEVLMRRRMHRDSFSHTEYGIEEVFTMLRARIARSGGAPL